MSTEPSYIDDEFALLEVESQKYQVIRRSDLTWAVYLEQPIKGWGAATELCARLNRGGSQ